jgi:hypothetical protein
MSYPTDEQIQVRAYELWERAGKPDGKNNEFWHLAERDLLEKADQPPPSEHAEPATIPHGAL